MTVNLSCIRMWQPLPLWMVVEVLGAAFVSALLLGGLSPDSPSTALWGILISILSAPFLIYTPPQRLLTPSAAAILIGSYLFSLDRDTSLSWTATFLAVLLLNGLLERLDTTSPWERLWKWVIAAWVVSVAYTFLQAYSLRSHLEQLPPPGFMPPNALFNTVWLASACLAITGSLFDRFRFLSLNSHILHKISLGFLSVLITMVTGLLIYGRQSRSSLLILILGTVMLSRIRFRWMRLIIITGALSIIVLAAATPFLQHRFQVASHDSLRDYRINIWRSAWSIFIDHPLTGVGPGNFEIGYQRYPVEETDHAVLYGRTTSFAHNVFLQAATDTGIAGFLLCLTAVWLMIRNKPPAHKPFAWACWATALLIVLAGCFNPVLQRPFLLLWTLILAAFVRHERNLSLISDRSHDRERRFLWLGILIVCTWLNISALIKHQPMTATGSEPPSILTARIQRSPSNVYLRESLARALESHNTPESLQEAALHYEMAIRLAPSRAINYVALGRILYRFHLIPNAQSRFEEARRIEPHYWEADLWIARCKAAQGQVRAALFQLRHLEKRRQAVLRRFRSYAVPRSAYEEQILGYDSVVVEQERKRISRMTQLRSAP